MTRRIYLDNTATTRTRREVVRVVEKYLAEEYGNPSSLHRSGLVARGSVEMARERIARVLHCPSQEIIFTGSGTESNNMAIRGAVRALGEGSKLVSSRIEHSSILNTCKALGAEGTDVRYIDVDRHGRYHLDQLDDIDDRTIVSLSYVNNEIGTVQDVDRVRTMTKGRGGILHIDAVQALPYFRIDMRTLGADMVSFSGHKIYAPKGIGLLFLKDGTPYRPMILGGGQESGARSGTENVASIVGLSHAIDLNDKEKDRYVARLTKMRDRTIKGVLERVPDSMLTGHPEMRSPNNASFCFKGLNGKMLVKRLAWEGIEASSGSACSSPKNDPSHVLSACNIDKEYLMGSLRITLGMYNRERDVDLLLKVLPRVVGRMRSEGVAYDNSPMFISQEEFRKKLDEKGPMQILDLRDVKYPRIEVPGAIHVPSWRLKFSLKGLDKEKETILICYQGDVVSPEVQLLLTKRGFRNVKVLKGGIFNYGHGPSL